MTFLNIRTRIIVYCKFLIAISFTKLLYYNFEKFAIKVAKKDFFNMNVYTNRTLILTLTMQGTIWCLIRPNIECVTRIRSFFHLFRIIQKISKNSPTYFQLCRININTSNRLLVTRFRDKG